MRLIGSMETSVSKVVQNCFNKDKSRWKIQKVDCSIYFHCVLTELENYHLINLIRCLVWIHVVGQKRVSRTICSLFTTLQQSAIFMSSKCDMSISPFFTSYPTWIFHCTCKLLHCHDLFPRFTHLLKYYN